MRTALLSMLSTTRRLLIFTYHRVLAQRDDLLPGEPTREDFEKHAALIAKHLNVLPLGEAVERLYGKSLPPRAACITFDDGYRNNYEIAAPILEKYALTATFFVATGAIEAGSMFNDRVIEAVRHARGRMDLSKLGLGAWECGDASSRRMTVAQLLDRIKYRPHEERDRLSHEIYDSVVAGAPLNLMMTPPMIKDLAERGFDVGGHTVTHPILAQLSSACARAEIAEGREWLAAVIGRPPTTFAYPNGRPGVDFLPEHARLVEDVGFDCAVSTVWSVATPSHNRFALPRLTPWETTERGWLTRLAKSYVKSWIER